jgi:RHS repeat-associated protein
VPRRWSRNTYTGSGCVTCATATVVELATFNARDQVPGSGATSYQYTARGTLSSETSGSTTTNYLDDAFDQLTSAGSATYTHDGLGRLASASGYNLTYDGLSDNVASDGLETFNRTPSGQVISGGAGGFGVEAFTNQHDEITGTYTSAGASLISSNAYDPNGNQTATVGPTTDLGYQSGWTDPTTGDTATASRWYDPTTATFTSHDTLTDNTGTSAQANPYTYANDDPLNGIDPAGHLTPSPIDTACETAPAECDAAGDACPECALAGGIFDAGWWMVQGYEWLKSRPGSSSSPAKPVVRPHPPTTYTSLNAVGIRQLHESTGIPIYGVDGRGGAARTRTPSGHGSPAKVKTSAPPHPNPRQPTPAEIVAANVYRTPTNARPVGQQIQIGEVLQPGTKIGDTLTGDAPIDTNTTRIPNPSAAISPTSPINEPNTGVGVPAPLLPTQGYLADAQCSGGHQKYDTFGRIYTTGVSCVEDLSSLVNVEASSVDSYTPSGYEIRYSSTGIAIGADQSTLNNFVKVSNTGLFDVFAHGSQDGYILLKNDHDSEQERVNAGQLADAIRGHPGYTGQACRFLVCHSGRSGVAQQLANELGVPILAPTDLVGTVAEWGGGQDPRIARKGYWVWALPQE